MASQATTAVAATAANTYGNLSLSSGATVTNGPEATLAATYGAVTVSSAATVAIGASTSKTIDALLASSNATINVAATASIGYGNITVASTGVIPPSTPAEATLAATFGAITLFSEASSGEEGGGRLIRRRRYGVRNRIYEADVEEVAEIAEALNVPLEEVKEVTKGPERNRNGDGRPRNKDDFGYSFWYPHEVWGRASKGWQDKFTSPLGEDFFRAIEALKRAEQQKQHVYTAIRQQNNDLLLLLLMT